MVATYLISPHISARWVQRLQRAENDEAPAFAAGLQRTRRMTNEELSSNEKMIKIDCGVRHSRRNLEFLRHSTFVIRHFPTFACRGHVILCKRHFCSSAKSSAFCRSNSLIF